jgi:hypothetical protein
MRIFYDKNSIHGNVLGHNTQESDSGLNRWIKHLLNPEEDCVASAVQQQPET